MSNLEERSLESVDLPALSPSPQPSGGPRPFLLALSGAGKVRLQLGGGRERGSSFPNSHSTRLPPLPTPALPSLPRCCRHPSAPPPVSETLAGADWVEDASSLKGGGVVSSGRPPPPGLGGRERHSGDRRRRDALVLRSFSKKH